MTLRFREPHRGEIIVFHPPSCAADGDCRTASATPRSFQAHRHLEQTYIKRVIGLPGETLFSRAGHVWVIPAGGGPPRS